MYLMIDFLPKYNASMNFYLQKFLRTQHAMNVCHILEPNIIQYNYNLWNFREQWEYVQTVLIHTYSYGNMPAKDQKSEFILEYIRKFHHFELLSEVLQIGGQ